MRGFGSLEVVAASSRSQKRWLGVAFDRGIRMIEKFAMQGPLKRWERMRSKIHSQVCKHGFHRGMNSFTQSYGSKDLDSSLLLLPLVGSSRLMTLALPEP